jgi:twinfilin-like protein
MSATSGIQVSSELQSSFSSAVESQTTRFLKISISSESLVHDCSIPAKGQLLDDLQELQTLLQDDVPAYVLTRLDNPTTEWLAIFYVPETAKIRDKMLYASTRSSLLKSLGSQIFVDQIFATTKADLTPDAYKSHRRHLEAPKPLSKQEQELEDVKAAEREGGLNAYEGSSVRRNNVGRVDVVWSNEVEDALKALAEGEGSNLVILSIDPSEAMVLHSAQEVVADDIGKTLPQSEICFAFFAWPAARGGSAREIVYIYSCPSASSVKLRMLYSVSSRALYTAVQTLFQSTDTTSVLASRKVETSDPQEINEKFLISELGPASTDGASAASTPVVEEQKRFARPKGPGRKR